MKLAHGEAMRQVIRAQVHRHTTAVRGDGESALDREAKRELARKMAAFYERTPIPARPPKR